MSPLEVNNQLFRSCGRLGNVISWPEVRSKLAGAVSVQETSQACSITGKTSCGSTNPECYCQNNNIFNAAECEKKIHSCYPNPCKYNQTCVSDGKVSHCLCSPGLKGKFCQYDVNECAYQNGKCQYECINTIGSYKCKCMPGSELASDEHSCEIMSRCESSEGKIYRQNEVWEDGCRNCTCTRGKIFCRLALCPPPQQCPVGYKYMYTPGHCCAVCTPLPVGVCSVNTDNQYKSFDRKILKFTSTCRYVLAQDCVAATFSIQMENSQQQNYKKKIMIIADCTNVTITIQGKVAIDGKFVRLPYIQNEIVKVHAATPESKASNFQPLFGTKNKTHSIVVILENNVTVLWSPKGLVEVGVQDNMKHRVCGLCGNFNGKQHDDLATRTYIQAKTLADFIFSWRVDPSKHCPSPNYGLPGKPPRAKKTGTCKNSVENYNRALNVCGHFRLKDFSPCYASVNPREYYDLCIQDACFSADGNSYCDSINAYVAVCNSTGGISIHGWDKNKLCSSRCKNGMVFSNCGPRCARTCSGTELADPLCRSNSCRTGCHCPTELVLHEGHCIAPSACPITL